MTSNHIKSMVFSEHSLSSDWKNNLNGICLSSRLKTWQSILDKIWWILGWGELPVATQTVAATKYLFSISTLSCRRIKIIRSSDNQNSALKTRLYELQLLHKRVLFVERWTREPFSASRVLMSWWQSQKLHFMQKISGVDFKYLPLHWSAAFYILSCLPPRQPQRFWCAKMMQEYETILKAMHTNHCQQL